MGETSETAKDINPRIHESKVAYRIYYSDNTHRQQGLGFGVGQLSFSRVEFCIESGSSGIHPEIRVRGHDDDDGDGGDGDDDVYCYYFSVGGL